MSDVIIVGAGIVGLSTAFWLVKAGHAVTVVEQGSIPNPVAASADHHRLIRYPYGAAQGYCARMREGFSAWRAMWADLPGPPQRYFADTGILCVSQHGGDYTDVSTRVMEQAEVPFDRIAGADIPDRFPFLAPGNHAFATLSEGGALMANHILTDLADWLRRAGAQVLEHMPVASVDTATGAVKLADGRTLSAERVIVSAGIGTSGLLPGMDLPLIAHRSVIVYADPPEDLSDLYADAPCWNALGGDLDLWGMPAMDDLPMKLGNGAMGFQDPGAANRAMSSAELQRMLADYALRFRGAEQFRIRWHQANHWTQAPGSRFLLRQEGRALAVSACSGHGFKFGALSGRDVAEAIDGRPLDEVQQRMAAQAA